MAYLVGLILGNGEIQQDPRNTTITIDIPHRNLYTDDNKDVSVYVRASVVDIRSIVEPLIGHELTFTQSANVSKLSFVKNNDDYTIREIIRLIGAGYHHSSMRMNQELFNITNDQKRSLLRGIADTTGYIRRANNFFNKWAHRVYIEIPRNWDLVIDIANMLRDVDIPIQNINFGHPNFRDGNLKDYNKGHINSWKKEHQIKIFANEFIPIGFNITHKQESLEKLSAELLQHMSPETTHKFYWERKTIKKKPTPTHPGEKDTSLPLNIRDRHFNSWQELSSYLGYGPQR